MLSYQSYYWVREASPTLGCSIEISCDIYVCWYVSLSRETHTKIGWTIKKRSLINEKLKANSASETEEQRKERLRIRREKDRARRRLRKAFTRPIIFQHSILVILQMMYDHDGSNSGTIRVWRGKKYETSWHASRGLQFMEVSADFDAVLGNQTN